MDPLWMILPLFVVYAETKNLTVEVELGQNVTLNCSFNAARIYWFMEIHSQFRAHIAHTHSWGSDKNYYVSTSVTKFVVINGTSLMITNVTADDCRFYICSKKTKDDINLEETFHIVSVPDVPVTPSTTVDGNHLQQQQHICNICQSELVVFSSFALNIFFVVTIGGFVFTSLCLKTRCCKNPLRNLLPFTCKNPETQETPQYEEIEFPSSREPPPAAAPPECVYSKAQLPQPAQRPH